MFTIKPELRNHTERIVLEAMEELLKRPEYQEICQCQQCLTDIATYALNRLPAKYISCPQGELQTKISDFENQVMADVTTAVVTAIEVVSHNPRH